MESGLRIDVLYCRQEERGRVWINCSRWGAWRLVGDSSGRRQKGKEKTCNLVTFDSVVVVVGFLCQ